MLQARALSVQESEHGVILVSLGSHFDAVPEAWLQEFCKAFSSLKYTIIWKLKVNPPCQLTANVHVRPWVPQNDLLAHPKLVLFVTHAGYNSVLESVSHGKPMLAFPISLDQPYNAQIIRDKGLGEVLSIKTFKAQDLISAVGRVLSVSASYTENAKRAAKLLGSKALTPADRISFWIDHVVQFGASHMRSAAIELNIFKFLMIDIYLFLFSVGLGLVVSLVVGVRCLYKCLASIVRKCSREKTHAD